ncbi:hypothetical protein L2Y96_18190 [Luteibacter aegosomaticola]|uniref:hypothetical protein n=1 Tax=Luteibacter aegosomaticola TaxID=2911538 RepID=UPI001FF74DD4|nr:hypothetical protein [Luteibacter aegosomaticola]UPG89309.1 hypothetical protein L2Y96_18190 [Luteibacter aegosomaticola]
MTTTISPEDFEKAVRRACVRAIARAVASEPLRAGDRTAVQHGAVLKDIADEADLSIPQTRRHMRVLQDAGKAIRDDRRGGSTAWWLVGLAAELKGPDPVCAPRQGVTAMPVAAPPAHAVPSTIAARQTVTTQRDNWWEVLGVNQDDSFRDCTAAYREAHARLLSDESPEAPALIDRLKTAYDGAAKAHEVQVTE